MTRLKVDLITPVIIFFVSQTWLTFILFSEAKDLDLTKLFTNDALKDVLEDEHALKGMMVFSVNYRHALY